MARFQRPIFINNPEKTVPEEITAQFFKMLETGDVDQVRQFALSNRNKYNIINRTKQSATGQTPYHAVLKLDDNIADETAKLELIKYLEIMGAPMDLPDLNNQWPIHLAVATQSYKIVKFFVEKGVNVERADSSNNTPLHYAATGKSTACRSEPKIGRVEDNRLIPVSVYDDLENQIRKVANKSIVKLQIDAIISEAYNESDLNGKIKPAYADTIKQGNTLPQIARAARDLINTLVNDSEDEYLAFLISDVEKPTEEIMEPVEPEIVEDIVPEEIMEPEIVEDIVPEAEIFVEDKEPILLPKSDNISDNTEKIPEMLVTMSKKLREQAVQVYKKQIGKDPQDTYLNNRVITLLAIDSYLVRKKKQELQAKPDTIFPEILKQPISLAKPAMISFTGPINWDDEDDEDDDISYFPEIQEMLDDRPVYQSIVNGLKVDINTFAQAISVLDFFAIQDFHIFRDYVQPVVNANAAGEPPSIYRYFAELLDTEEFSHNFGYGILAYCLNSEYKCPNIADCNEIEAISPMLLNFVTTDAIINPVEVAISALTEYCSAPEPNFDLVRVKIEQILERNGTKLNILPKNAIDFVINYDETEDKDKLKSLLLNLEDLFEFLQEKFKDVEAANKNPNAIQRAKHLVSESIARLRKMTTTELDDTFEGFRKKVTEYADNVEKIIKTNVFDIPVDENWVAKIDLSQTPHILSLPISEWNKYISHIYDPKLKSVYSMVMLTFVKRVELAIESETYLRSLMKPFLTTCNFVKAILPANVTEDKPLEFSDVVSAFKNAYGSFYDTYVEQILKYSKTDDMDMNILRTSAYFQKMPKKTVIKNVTSFIEENMGLLQSESLTFKYFDSWNTVRNHNIVLDRLSSLLGILADIITSKQTVAAVNALNDLMPYLYGEYDNVPYVMAQFIVPYALVNTERLIQTEKRTNDVLTEMFLVDNDLATAIQKGLGVLSGMAIVARSQCYAVISQINSVYRDRFSTTLPLPKDLIAYELPNVTYTGKDVVTIPEALLGYLDEPKWLGGDFETMHTTAIEANPGRWLTIEEMTDDHFPERNQSIVNVYMSTATIGVISGKEYAGSLKPGKPRMPDVIRSETGPVRGSRGRGSDRGSRGRGLDTSSSRGRGRGFDPSSSRGRGRGFDPSSSRGRGFDPSSSRGSRGFDPSSSRGSRGFDPSSSRGRGRGFDPSSSRGRGTAARGYPRGAPTTRGYPRGAPTTRGSPMDRGSRFVPSKPKMPALYYGGSDTTVALLHYLVGETYETNLPVDYETEIIKEVAVRVLKDMMIESNVNHITQKVLAEYKNVVVDPENIITNVKLHYRMPKLSAVPEYLMSDPNQTTHLKVTEIYDMNALVDNNSYRRCFAFDPRIVTLVFTPRNSIWRNSDGDTPLHLAIGSQNVQAVQKIIELSCHEHNNWKNLKNLSPLELSDGVIQSIISMTYGDRVKDSISFIVDHVNPLLISTVGATQFSYQDTVFKSTPYVIPAVLVWYNLEKSSDIVKRVNDGTANATEQAIVDMLQSAGLVMSDANLDFRENVSYELSDSDDVFVSTNASLLRRGMPEYVRTGSIESKPERYRPDSIDNTVGYLNKPMEIASSMIIHQVLKHYSLNVDASTEFFRSLVEKIVIKDQLKIADDTKSTINIVLKMTFAEDATSFIIDQFTRYFDNPDEIAEMVKRGRFNGYSLKSYLEREIIDSRLNDKSEDTYLQTFIPDILRSGGVYLPDDSLPYQRLTEEIIPFVMTTLDTMIRFIYQAIYGYERFILSTYQKLQIRQLAGRCG